MGDRHCWLVGGGLKNTQASAPKDQPKQQIPALFQPPKNASQTKEMTQPAL